MSESHEILLNVVNEIKTEIPKTSSRNEHYHPLVAPYAEHIETIYTKTGWIRKKKIVTIIFKIDTEWINMVITGIKTTDLPAVVIYDKKYYKQNR